MLDLFITGADVVLEGAVSSVNIGIQGERISALVDRETSLEAREVIDAKGKVIIPGVIDPHVHFSTFSPHIDTFETAAVSAAHGGVTTMIPFIFGQKERSLLNDVKHFIKEGEETSVIDFGLHARILPTPQDVQDIPEIIKLGVNTIKMFMAYRKRGIMIDDYHLTKAMEVVAKHGGLAMVHAENGDVIDYLEDKYIAEGKRGSEHYAPTRPNSVEAEAINRAVIVAAHTSCPLYVVHLSAEEGLQEIIRAKAQGKRLYAETCPQYLTLTDETMKGQGALAKIAPPMRDPKDLDAMWFGIQKGFIDTIGSDHAPYTIQQKREAGDNIFGVPFGMAGLETLLPILYSEGVAKGRLTLSQLVDLTSKNVAKVFGLYPKKGVIRIGSDADLVAIDPNLEWEIKAVDLHTRSDSTCFEGWQVKGKSVMSLLRGKVLLKEGALMQKKEYGKFIARPVS
ncbi:MAG: dihydropyrimidinase [Candidatus Tectomicrobia bacterium]|nr:dihydropyrimidinase [Candidatus Tectomicrobia bacterium]